MSKSKDRVDLLGPVWVYLLALALFFLRFGYAFALGDQDEFIPFIHHRLDPSLLANDWFVNTQLGFSVRTMFVELLLPFCRLFAIEDVAVWGYLLLWLAIGAGAYHLPRAFDIGRVASAGSVAICLGILHKWTLGSNDLVYTMLVPEMAAWALALPAVRVFVSGSDKLRHLLWPVLLAVAAWFQVLVGILVFGCLIAVAIWEAWQSHAIRSDWRRIATSLSAFVIVSLPVVVPILWHQTRDPMVGDGPSIFYILAPFRNPVHHMLLSFPTKSVIRFAIMAIAALGSLVWLDRRRLIRHTTFLRRLGALILLGCVVMFVCTELYPVLFVAKLQLYKLTVLFKLLALGLIAAVVESVLPAGLIAFGDSLLRPGIRRLAITMSVIGVISVSWFAMPGLVHERLMLESHRNSDLGKMERWIADQTDPSAVFAIPPANSTFRSNARRAIVVNFMAFPYKDPEMVEWFTRIQALAPVGLPETGLHIRPQLDYAFEQLGADDLSRLARTYGFDYVLRQTPLEGLESVHSIGAWTLYRAGQDA